MSDKFTILGVDWSDVGKKTLGGLHTVGKVTLSLFGAGKAIAPLERLEQRGGALPTWAASAVTVTAPDYALMGRSSDPQPVIVKAPAKVVVFGGARGEGNGYARGDAPTSGKFSFGFDSPARVEIVVAGKTQSFTDVKTVLFLGGKEDSDTVLGEREMAKIVDEVLGYTDAFGNPVDQFGNPLSAQVNVDAFGNPLPAEASLPPAGGRMSSAFRAAQARAQHAQDRLAQAKAMQAPAFTYTPAAMQMSAIEVPVFNVTTPGVSMDSLEGDILTTQRGSEIDEILGEENRSAVGLVMEDNDQAVDEVYGDDVFPDPNAGDLVVLGYTPAEPSEWTEILGESDYCMGTDVLGLVPGAASQVAPALNPALTKRAQLTSKRAPLAAQAQKRLVPTTKITTKGKLQFKRAGRSTNKSPHKLALTRTLNASNRALRAGEQAKNRATNFKAPGAPTLVHGDEAFAYEIMGETLEQKREKARKAAKAILDKILPTKLHGCDDVLGAGAGPWTEIVGAQPLTAVQQAAVNKRDAASRRTQTALANLKKRSERASASAKKAAAAVAKARPIIAKLLKKVDKPHGPTRVHGDFEVFGETEAEKRAKAVAAAKAILKKVLPKTGVRGCEDELVGANIPGDPNYDPRFPDDYGDPSLPPAGGGFASDPGYSDPYANPSMGAGSPSDYSDGGDIPLPVRGQPLSQDEANTLWGVGVPDDAVIYQGERGFPDGSIGSFTRFFGPKQYLRDMINAVAGTVDENGTQRAWIKDWLSRHPSSPLAKVQNAEITPGYIWGRLPANNDSGMIGNGWSAVQQPGDWAPIIARVATHPENDDGEIERWVTPHSEANWTDPSAPYWIAIAKDSETQQWGPLVGNPKGPLAGLQFDTASGQWFWQSDKAPVWATAAQDAQITALNKAANDAAAQAAAADQARMDLEQQQYAEAQAAQDAQLALAQQAADQQAAITQTQIDQQLQIADAQAAAQQTALDLQQAALMQQAMKADFEYGMAHPEEFAEQQMQEEVAPEDLTDLTDRDAGVDQFDRSDRESDNPFDVPTQQENEAAASAFDQEG